MVSVFPCSSTALRFPLFALIVAIGLAGAGTLVAQDTEVEGADGDAPTVNTYVLPDAGPFAPEKVAIPNATAIGRWARSGHSNIEAEAFRHWDEDGAIPPACSVCHSGAGFRSYHGLDGSEKGLPAEPVSVGGVVDCETCHNPGIAEVTAITMPSGLEHPVSNGEASCFTCHQGRAAGNTVSAAVEGLETDTPSADLRYINPHYAIAASSVLGGYGGGGFEYPGKSYSGRFLHAKPVATCVSCHNPHSLEVAQETCLTCHTTGDPSDVRISRVSYDGSGNLGQGIRADMDANTTLLEGLILDYARDIAGTPILIADGYPYFFADANSDGVADEAEGRAVAYNAFTPRLLQAIYNYKFVKSDPGIFAHNPHYALELLYDSIEDLTGALGGTMAEMNLYR